MALSATFTANFASFYDAVDKADTKLKDFGAGADKVGGRLTALGNSFSGVKIIQDATLMVKAVEDIGGASKLTEKELARLGATTNEAVAKMKALGMEVPQNLQAIADKTKGANKATSDWMGSLTKIAGAVGIAFSVDAIVNFVGSVFDAASAIKDLSDQWGVSTTIVQQWTGAAKQSGVEAETVGKSVQFLTEQLSEGSDQYVALLKNVGLSYDKLRQMPLADAYKAVITAIAGIKDETLQLDVAQGLLGVSSKKMVGAIRDGFLEAADAQKVMSEETIKRLEAAQNAWEKFKNAVVIDTGEMLAAVGMTTESMTRSWGNFFSIVGHGIVGTFLPATNKSAAALVVMDQAMDGVGKSAKTTAPAIDHVTDAGAKLTTGIKTQAQVAEDLRQKTERLKQAEKNRADALAQAKRDEDAYTNALIAHDTAISDLVDTFDGRNLIQKANLYIEALKQSIPIEQMTATQQANINAVMLAAIEVYDAAGQSAPQVLYDIWGATVKVEEVTDDFGKTLDDIMVKMGKIKGIDLTDIGWTGTTIRPGDMPTPPPLPTDNLKEYLTLVEGLSGALVQVGQHGGAAFQAVTRFAEIAVKGMMAYRAATTSAEAATVALGVAMGIATFGISLAVGGVATAITTAAADAKATRQLMDELSAAIIALGGTPTTALQQMSGTFLPIQSNIEALRTQLTELQRQAKVLQDRLDHVKDKTGELGQAVQAFGGVVPAAMRPLIDQLLKSTDLTDDMRAALGKFTEDPSWQTLETHAKDLGIDLKAMGTQFQQAKIGDIAFGYVHDLQMFSDSGANMQLVIEGMSDELSNLYANAQSTGAKLPNTLKPYYETLVAQGRLLDENGEKVDHLNDDTFADIEDKGLKAVVTILESIRDLLKDSLPRAADEGAAKIQENFNKAHLKVPVDFDYADNPPPAPHGPVIQPAPGGGGGPGMESFQGGTDGFKNFGAGTPVLLHGWEAVVPREDAGAFATVRGAGGGTTASAVMPSIVINAQGAFFETPESLQRLATKVSDALTAKYSVMGKLRAAG